ncbi:hypothetical protein D9M72_539400 [compost metagenome]
MQRQGAEPEIGDRHHQDDQAHDVLHEPGHGKKHDPLEQRQARSAQGAVVEIERLDAALAPALTLDEIARQVLGCQPHRQALVQVTGLVAFVQHRQCRQQIFGDRLRREAANRIDCLAAGDRARPTAEADVPDVAARSDLVEKEALFVRPDVLQTQV